MNVHEPITRADDPRYLDAVQSLHEMAIHRPFGGYRVLYIDFPWLYENWSSKGADRGALKHYPCMTTELGAKLPVSDIASSNCALFMWATWPLIFDTRILIEAWGFEYSGLAWEWRKVNPETGKAAFGPGYGTRKNLEPCLLARRGKPKLKSRSERDYLEAPRRQHSRKPDEAYSVIERMFDGPYCELFARQARPGWAAFGNEVDKFDEVAA